MFKKIKFLLVCAIIAIGATACSSDDNSVSPDEHKVVITTSGGAVLNYVGLDVFTNETTHLDIGLELDGATEWTKTFERKEGTDLHIVVSGRGVDENSKIKVVVTKGTKVIGDREFKGERDSNGIRFLSYMYL